MNTTRRILKNFLSLSFAEVFAVALSFITVPYLARTLGPGDFGKISFALAIVTYFIMASNLGLETLGTREVARDRGGIKDYVGNIVALRLSLGILAFGLLLLLVFFLPKPSQIKYLIILYGLGILPSVLLFSWVFQGIERMEYIGGSRILGGLVYVGLILLLVKSSKQLLLIPGILVFSNLLACSFLIFVFIKHFGGIRLRFNFPLWKKLIPQALPIGLTGVMSVIIYYFDTVMLGFMRSNEEVGYYNAAFKIILLLIVLSTAYLDAIFPVLSNYYKTSLDSFKKLQSYTIKLMVTAALPLAVGGVILARPIMDLVYGAEYGGGIIAFQILIWAGALLYINSAYSRGLWACDKQDTVLKIVSLHAAIILVFNFILIPPFGLIGASIASLFGKVCEFLMYYRASGKIFKVPIHSYISKPLLASAIMGLFLWLAPNWNVLWLVFGGASVYLALFYLMRGVTREEMILIKSTIPRGKS